MRSPGTEPPTLRGAGRMGRRAFARDGRHAAQRVVRRGGSQLARLERTRAGQAMLVVGIYVLMPLLFDPDLAGDLDARFELRILDPHGGDPEVASVVVREGKCRIGLGPAPPARVSVSAGAGDLVRMASGEIGWPQLVSAGRLVLWGDPYLALRFPMLFGMPAGPGAPALLKALPSRRDLRGLTLTPWR